VQSFLSPADGGVLLLPIEGLFYADATDRSSDGETAGARTVREIDP